MKKIIILAFIFLGISALTNAQNTILEARAMSEGTVVTLKGIVTNGAELGTIRYFQDNTAGIAAYEYIPAMLSAVNRGDSVTITGTLKLYNQLLELDPIANVDIMSTGNPLPAPIVLTPAEIGETYEGRLVQINNASFNDAGGIFAEGIYTITASGESANIYIKTGQDIVGQDIPHGLVNLTAIASQRTYTGSGGYQLLPRDMNDIQQTSSIYLIGAMNNTNFTKTELDFNWTTNIVGTTEMFYGQTAETVRANQEIGIGGDTDHSIALSGFSAGEIVWTQAFSVSGSDTAFSGIMPFATISNSSGDIKVYFSTPSSIIYSSGIDAIYLDKAIDDTLIEYIDRAKYTIDLAIYNSNNYGITNISTALKAAADRGVLVRVIGCGTTANLGLDELAGSAVNVFIGPSDYQRTGIMHNKFMIFDAESADANDPLVWTGSTNFTEGNINTDANNVIIVQDQSLARSYQIEFEEMWGSTDSSPNAANARFGFFKKNNTPHEFMINGKRVECYFSPSDGVNAKIVENINTSNTDLRIATMLLTRDEIATAIAQRHSAGVAVNMLTDDEGTNVTSVNTILNAALGSSYYVFYPDGMGTMHNKYMVIDQGELDSDPLVLTGSHNWSAAANNDNDENTLIVHDATIANIYFQNFAELFVASSGILLALDGIEITETPDKNALLVFPNPVQNGNINLSFFLTSADKGTLQLIDISGKLVFSQTIELTSGENTLKYSIPATYKGSYILRLITTNQELTQKVLFE